jgi:hypothetical protein
MIEYKNKSLLAALNLLLEVNGYNKELECVINRDVSSFYFTIYFYLSLRKPSDSQFNIWNNITNLSKLNSQ